jgi:glyoxylase-like metal-dependent hydrolase (beta-lactamase superfamily II)
MRTSTDIGSGSPGNPLASHRKLPPDSAPGPTRDAARVSVVLKLGNVIVPDYVIIQHFHVDHACIAVELANRIPIRLLTNHGPYTVVSNEGRC